MFFHSSLEFVEHFNDHCFERFIKYITCVCFIRFFSSGVLSYSFIWNKIYCLLICLTFCVYFYGLVKRVTSPSLKCGALCRSITCVDCLCWLALASQLDLEWEQAGPGGCPGGRLCQSHQNSEILKSTNQRVFPLEMVT